MLTTLRRIGKPLRNNAGVTLVEYIAYVALASMVIVASTIGISKSRESGALDQTLNQTNLITAGLTEYQIYKGKFPKQDTMSTTWPAALQTYIPAALQAGGANAFGYQCNSLAASKDVILRTPALTNATEATNVMTKLVDQGICDSSSTTNVSYEIDCKLNVFEGLAGCT